MALLVAMLYVDCSEPQATGRTPQAYAIPHANSQPALGH